MEGLSVPSQVCHGKETMAILYAAEGSLLVASFCSGLEPLTRASDCLYQAPGICFGLAVGTTMDPFVTFC